MTGQERGPAVDQAGLEDDGPSFQWWMMSYFGFGAGFMAFISLLVPPFVTEATGNAAEAGVVMAIISLAAVLGPVLGNFADRYDAHRLVLVGGMIGVSASLAMYAISAGTTVVTALDAIVAGTGIAAISAVAPAFVLGARLSPALRARRLTTLNLMAPVGQVVGGGLVGAAAAAGWSYPQRFWLASGFMLATALVVLPASRAPAAAIKSAPEAPVDDPDGGSRGGLGRLLRSTFGIYLVVLVLSSAGNNGVNAQIANIMPQVYGIGEATTSALISLAGLLNIVGFVLAGVWMSRSGAWPGFVGGNVMRMGGAVALALLGMVTDAPVLLAAASMQLFYFSNPFVRLAQPVVALRVGSLSAGATSGWVIGAAAVGSFVGSLAGGWLADAVGFNAINWMAVVSVGLGLMLMVVRLRADDRGRDPDEQDDPAARADPRSTSTG